ncbi:MFS transporter [Sciscionella marina]|uniref:MFS transporter n=1 Tax=Sciscionella marina TaxID=508770 RepID=UPI000366AD36|nr:MFS transporter [Sciscionella marina]
MAAGLFARPARSQPESRRARAVIAGTIGNFVEWYDWALYGLMFPFFAGQLFPGTDTSSRISALSVLAISFLMRPVGAAVLGAYGDRKGRKSGLAATILLMGGSSLLFAVVPSYAAAGWLAPALVILARFGQGIATGGEYGASSAYLTEWAKPGRRAFTASFQQVCVGLGVLGASASVTILSALLSDTAMHDWGWRIPFAIGAVAGLVGLWLRSKVAEPEPYQNLERSGTVERAPLREMLGAHRKAALLLGGLSLSGFVTYYMWLTYLPSYANITTGIDKASASLTNTIGLAVFAVVLPFIAILSDRIGRKPTLLIYSVGTVLLAYPLLTGLTGGFGNLLLIGTAGLLLQAFSSATLTPLYAELFPARVRTVGIALPYAVCGALFAGTAPLIMEAFADAHINWAAPVYVIAVALITTVVVWRMPETKDRSLA